MLVVQKQQWSTAVVKAIQHSPRSAPYIAVVDTRSLQGASTQQILQLCCATEKSKQQHHRWYSSVVLPLHIYVRTRCIIHHFLLFNPSDRWVKVKFAIHISHSSCAAATLTYQTTCHTPFVVKFSQKQIERYVASFEFIVFFILISSTRSGLSQKQQSSSISAVTTCTPLDSTVALMC